MAEPLRAAVVQESGTGQVLMLGWMDEEALARTRESGLVHFYSRSRRRLWQKGETSGNLLHLEDLTADCDGDALLVTVHREGPTCHTGTVSCFAPWLWRTVLQRVAERPEGSYTARLVAQGVGRVAQKVGEEGVEAALAVAAGSREEVVGEVADLWFHSLVALAARGIDVTEVQAELRRRHRAG